MTSDRYVKAVLTVIAGCLVYICIALTTGPAVSAQPAPQEVILAGFKTAGVDHVIKFSPVGKGPSGPFPVREQ